jgi:hypothetical protein
MKNATQRPPAHLGAGQTNFDALFENETQTRKMLASHLKVSLRTIDKLQAEGLPCIFIGRSRRFLLSEVIAWLKRKGGQP